LSGQREDFTLTRPSLREADVLPSPAATGSIETGTGSSLPLVLGVLEDAKAEETVVIDLIGKTSLADAMIVTSGRSNRHVGSIADYVIEALKEHGVRNVRVEGQPHCDWVLIDAGDIIIHVFRPEVRSFYNLEKMWGMDRPGERVVS
jgi:ribosome-associated protein